MGRIAGIGSDTEEDGGSTPPAPTVSLLSSAFVGLLIRTGGPDRPARTSTDRESTQLLN
jgi:hypothetical protein